MLLYSTVNKYSMSMYMVFINFLDSMKVPHFVMGGQTRTHACMITCMQAHAHIHTLEGVVVQW